MKKRFANKQERKSFAPYDSQFEKDLAEGVLSGVEYHTLSIKYTKPVTDHTYTPDFVLRKPGLTILIESKGRFIDTAEAHKYLHIRNCLKDDEELVFLFQHPGTPMPGAKRRKDGTVRTHAEFASKNKFRWYTKFSIEDLINEP